MASPTGEAEGMTVKDRLKAALETSCHAVMGGPIGVPSGRNPHFARIADFCIRHSWLIIVATVLLGTGAADYVTQHFALNTDTGNLISPHLAWRKRDLAYQTAFPQQAQSILAVVTAPTPEFSSAAAKTLTDRLSPQSTFFRSVEAASSGEFFTRNGLLYLSQNDLAARMTKLSEAAPVIKTLVSDPSLRGLAQTFILGLLGERTGRYSLDAMTRPLNTLADTIESVLAGRETTFSWQVFVNGAPAKPEDLTSLIDIWPVLNYRAVEPGQTATAAVRKTVKDAGLNSAYDATVRLTGAVPLLDHQFATLRQGVGFNSAITGAIILIVLWLALRSVRIVLAVVITILAGLVVSTALGLLLVGSFNPISVAFAVLFVGLGADFAIQFSVRYRAQRHELGDLKPSLIGAAGQIGVPLRLAALAAAAGFLSFVATSYRGVAELGLIAGCGMVVAYIASVTLLPALLWSFDPPGEPEPLGFRVLAGADRFLQRHRRSIVVATSVIVLLGLPFLFRLHFNFDPNSLQDPSSEAVVTLRQLNSDPRVVFNGAEVLTSPADAEAVANQLSGLPEVAGIRNLDSFIPDDQQEKLKLIANAAAVLDPALKANQEPTASDSEDVAALKRAAKDLRVIASQAAGSGQDAAHRLAKDLDALADGTAPLRQRVAATFLRPLQIDLQEISQSLHPQPITRLDLPTELVGAWTARNGLIRTEIVPKGDASDSKTLQRFARAVLAVQPTATGEAIEIYEWGRTVRIAFAEAIALALCSIAILLWLVLQRVGDVLVTLIPLLVAGAATLEICGLTGFSLDYSNIIALPALLGVGVAFKIYYVMAWRGGEANFLQSALTRAVFFSALMTATAFGSLWFSGHPAFASMGKLLALSLACTLASAALFQPALMGPPRESKSPAQPKN